MNGSISYGLIIKIVTPCKFEPEELSHVKSGDKVTFTNETDSIVRITFNNETIFNSGPIILGTSPENSVTLVVNAGEGGSVICSADCNYQEGGLVLMETKPQVVVNRD